MELILDRSSAASHYSVRLLVSLDRRETNELFLAGDRLISWPAEGLLSDGLNGPLERTSMFLSEIVSRPEGIELAYEGESQASRAQEVLDYQVRAAFGEAGTSRAGQERMP